jgi:flagellar hook-length control protein FliK
MSDYIQPAANPDAVSLNGGAGTAVSAGTAGSAPPGMFSGVLGERLQAAQQQPAGPPQQPVSPDQSGGNAVAAGGETAPLAGKPLPLRAQGEKTAGEQDEGTQGFADAAHLAALLQTLPVAVEQMAAAGSSQGDAVAVAEAGLAISGLPSALANTSLPGLTESRANTALAQNTPLPASSAPGTTTGPLSSLTDNTSTSLQFRTGSDAGRGTATLLETELAAKSPAMALGSPLSTNARLALQRALAADAKDTTTAAGGAVRAQSLGDAASAASPDAVRPAFLQSLLPAVKSALHSSQLPGQSADLILPKQTASQLLTATSAVAPAGDELGSASLLAAGQRAQPLSASGFMPQLHVATPLGQSGWASEVGQRVMMMANSELREAQLQLHPRSLGPVEVRIVYGHDQQLNVSFSAASPAAREALDAALPRLRDMFDQQGLNLANTDVSHESFAQQEQRQRADAEAIAVTRGLDSGYGEQTEAAMPPPILLAEGLVDAYA